MHATFFHEILCKIKFYLSTSQGRSFVCDWVLTMRPSPNDQAGRIHKQAFVVNKIAFYRTLHTHTHTLLGGPERSHTYFVPDVDRCSLCPLRTECGFTFLYSSTDSETICDWGWPFRRCSVLRDMLNRHTVLRYHRQTLSSPSRRGQPSERRHPSRLRSAVIRLAQVDLNLSHTCLVCHYGRQIRLFILFSKVDRPSSALGHLLVARYCL